MTSWRAISGPSICTKIQNLRVIISKSKSCKHGFHIATYFFKRASGSHLAREGICMFEFKRHWWQSLCQNRHSALIKLGWKVMDIMVWFRPASSYHFSQSCSPPYFTNPKSIRQVWHTPHQRQPHHLLNKHTHSRLMGLFSAHHRKSRLRTSRLWPLTTEDLAKNS